MKCTKIYNARAQLLFCSLNLLFSDVLVAVVVVVCLSSLLMATRQHGIYLFNITKKPKVVYDVICAFYQNARIIRRIV